MKKIIAIELCLLLVLSLCGCGTPLADSTDVSGCGTPLADSADASIEIENYDPVIDTASLDIDNDGVYENCTMAYGPTSGLFTVVITASVNGTVKYKNTFNIAWGDVSFGEKDGIAQFVRNGEYHKLYVEDKRIVIDNLDPQYEGYWGDSDWNYDLK